MFPRGEEGGVLHYIGWSENRERRPFVSPDLPGCTDAFPDATQVLSTGGRLNHRALTSLVIKNSYLKKSWRMSPMIYLLTKSDCSFRCPTNTTSTHTCSRHARFQALLKPTVAAGVARARVDDAISGQFARVRRVLDQSAAKELLKRTCIIHQHSTIYTRDSFDVDVASVVRRPR